jgi:hypothetical protein
MLANTSTDLNDLSSVVVYNDYVKAMKQAMKSNHRRGDANATTTANEDSISTENTAAVDYDSFYSEIFFNLANKKYVINDMK